MAAVETESAPPSRSRLPSPGCLLALLLVLSLATVCGWYGWCVYQRRAAMHYWEHFGRDVRRGWAPPERLSEFVVDTFGDEWQPGMTHITGIGGLDRSFTDADLQHLGGLTKLKYLYLYDTQVTEAGVQRLKEQLPDCWIGFTNSSAE